MKQHIVVSLLLLVLSHRTPGLPYHVYLYCFSDWIAWYSKTRTVIINTSSHRWDTLALAPVLCQHQSSYLWPGPWFYIKMSSYQCRKSHCGDKTVVRSSYLHNGIFFTRKMASLYWISLQIATLKGYVDNIVLKHLASLTYCFIQSNFTSSPNINQ